MAEFLETQEELLEHEARILLEDRGIQAAFTGGIHVWPTSVRRERCAGSGEFAHGHAHLCPCGRVFVAPKDAAGLWILPEHDGECSW